jgi:hypothetical protein
MKTIIITLATAVTFYGDVMAQQVLTLEDIYRHRKFSINSVQGAKMDEEWRFLHCPKK